MGRARGSCIARESKRPATWCVASLAPRRGDSHPPVVQNSTTPELLALQQAVAGKYTIEREIGRGGMGVVFLARDVALERQVALKMLPPALAAQPILRERFLREARTAAGLSHPNIVPIFAVEERDGLVYFAMGYVEGETLARRVTRAGPLPASEAARIVQEVAWALSYAHGRGVVHRDVKPDNILLEVGSGRAMVTDFGIARQTSAGNLTEMGHVVGTPQFMSPEQAAGEPLDGRSDIYSLGVVAFHALTGRLPFEAPSAAALLSLHLTQPAPPVASVRPGIPRPLADAIDRCLAKDPAARFASGEELGRAIGSTGAATATEIVPQVRYFMRYAEQITMITFIILIIGIEFTFFLRDTKGPARAMGIGLMVGMLLPIVDLFFRARRLLRQGFSYDDVRAGFLAELEARQREVELTDTDGPAVRRRRVVRALVVAAVGAWVMAAGVVWKAFTDLRTPERTAAKIVAVVGILTLSTGYVLAIFGNSRVERKGMKMYATIWTRGLGRGFFRLASWRLTRTTEVATRSVSDALEDLLAARPRADRRRAAPVLKAVRDLEARAERLRDRERELDGLLAQAGGGRALAELSVADTVPPPTGDTPPSAAGFDARRNALAADLRRARDETAERRAMVIAAVEAMRVQLLRVRAGLADVDELLRDAQGAHAAAEIPSPRTPRPAEATPAAR